MIVIKRGIATNEQNLNTTHTTFANKKGDKKKQIKS